MFVGGTDDICSCSIHLHAWILWTICASLTNAISRHLTDIGLDVVGKSISGTLFLQICFQVEIPMAGMPHLSELSAMYCMTVVSYCDKVPNCDIMHTDS